MYCYEHGEVYDENCIACSDDEKTTRPMRVYCLSHGYVAVLTNSLDEEFFGSHIVPLAFGAEYDAYTVVTKLRKANPANLVTYEGEQSRFETFMGRK